MKNLKFTNYNIEQNQTCKQKQRKIARDKVERASRHVVTCRYKVKMIVRLYQYKLDMVCAQISGFSIVLPILNTC